MKLNYIKKKKKKKKKKKHKNYTKKNIKFMEILISIY